jgi:hypothetical protein
MLRTVRRGAIREKGEEARRLVVENRAMAGYQSYQIRERRADI